MQKKIFFYFIIPNVFFVEQWNVTFCSHCPGPLTSFKGGQIIFNVIQVYLFKFVGDFWLLLSLLITALHPMVAQALGMCNISHRTLSVLSGKSISTKVNRACKSFSSGSGRRHDGRPLCQELQVVLNRNLFKKN